VVLDNSDKREKVRKFMDDEQKVKEFKLAYRASKDGYYSSDFHRKCDNIGPTLSLIKTTHGKTIGGYSKANWD
jgi:TLD